VRCITIITTGGTIEKTYDESSGQLLNRGSIVRRMIRRLRLEDTSVKIVELMSKDSLLLTDDDRAGIVRAVRDAGGEGPTDGTDAGGPPSTGIVILHGTDTLTNTGERLRRELKPRIPIILTGAMRPYEMNRSDALQNLTESIFAAGTLPPGVYCVAHGRALPFPGVRKDRGRGTFLGG
jgi:L-asparaginase